MEKQKELKTKKTNKERKDISKILLKVLLILLAVEIIAIPLLYIAEVKGKMGILFFIVFTTILALCITLLSRNCFNSYENKKKIILEKLK